MSLPEPPIAAVAPFLAAVRRDLLGREGMTAALRGERDAILGSWPHPRPVAMPAVPAQLPVCTHLAATMAAAASGPARDLAAPLASLLPGLRWFYFYPPHPELADPQTRIAFAQIIGRAGLLDDERLHLGLTLMAPQTHYPLHAHPAIELYLVLAGTAGWRVEGVPFNPQQPGSLILHTSGIGHAMRTDAEPLLALYFWRGDLATAPVYIDAPDAG